MYEEAECQNADCGIVFEKRTHNQQYHSLECKQAVKNARRRRQLVSDVVAAVATAYEVEDNPDLASHVEYLRQENRRLGRLYQKHKHNNHEILETIYQAAFDALSSINIPSVTPPRNTASGKNHPEEVCNPSLSDLQLGKATRSYNSKICRERIELFSDKVLEITDIQRTDHPVNRAHVYMLGDIVEGESIFAGQVFEIDSSLYSQIIAAVEILSDFLRRMLSTFETVHVAAVIGNHGRLIKGDFNPETNMDRLVYKFVSMLFANEKRITFNVPDGPGQSNFYTVDRIGNYSTLLLHGDQFPNPNSTHSYYKKVLGWKTGGIEEEFDDVILGHYHQNTKMTLGSTTLRICGTPESHNVFAQEVIGVMGRPSQHLQYVSPGRGLVTAEYEIWLDED